jgi:Zn-dependent M28 family amino/carboxypeptidase
MLYTLVIGSIFILLFLPDVTGTYRTKSESNLQSKGAVEEVTAQNLKETITHLQSYGNRSTWEKQWEAAYWVSDEFKNIELDVSIHNYGFDGRVWPNVISKIKGKERGEEVIMLTAHIDSISDNPQNIAPGADDNASGVAVLVKTARVLKETPMDRTIMFAIFTNEERGTAGSRAFARQVKNSGVNIKAVINLDILGYNRPAWPFYWDAVQSHATLKHKVKAIIRMARNYLAGLIKGKDVVKVAGREPNRELVAVTSRMIRKTTSLKVKELVSDDCG